MSSTIDRISFKPARSPRRLAKRLMVIGTAALIAAAAVWYGWSWWTLGRFLETTDDAYVGGEVTTIASKVAGFVETVAIADNQSVKAGDLLVELDDRDYRAQLARTEANVAAQDATLANLDANAHLQQAPMRKVAPPRAPAPEKR